MRITDCAMAGLFLLSVDCVHCILHGENQDDCDEADRAACGAAHAGDGVVSYERDSENEHDAREDAVDDSVDVHIGCGLMG